MIGYGDLELEHCLSVKDDEPTSFYLVAKRVIGCIIVCGGVICLVVMLSILIIAIILSSLAIRGYAVVLNEVNEEHGGERLC